MRIWNSFRSTEGTSFDPNEPSEIILTLELDESETAMAFHGIFGMSYQIDTIPREVKTLNITLFWGKDQLGDATSQVRTVRVW